MQATYRATMGGEMGMVAQACSAIESKRMEGIRVILCDPDDSVRADLRSVMDSDPLLTLVAECREWSACASQIDELVPELLIVRGHLLPGGWEREKAQDPFAPLVLTLSHGRPTSSPMGLVNSAAFEIPIDVERTRRLLNFAVTKIYDRKAKQLLYLVGRYVEASGQGQEYESFIKLQRDGQLIEVPTDTIMAVLAARKSVVIHTRDGQATLREPIHRIAEKLDPAVFVRVHRSVIINSRHVDRRGIAGKPAQILMSDGSRYPVGRNYRQGLAEHLQRQSNS